MRALYFRGWNLAYFAFRLFDKQMLAYFTLYQSKKKLICSPKMQIILVENLQNNIYYVQSASAINPSLNVTKLKEKTQVDIRFHNNVLKNIRSKQNRRTIFERLETVCLTTFLPTGLQKYQLFFLIS